MTCPGCQFSFNPENAVKCLICGAPLPKPEQPEHEAIKNFVPDWMPPTNRQSPNPFENSNNPFLSNQIPFNSGAANQVQLPVQQENAWFPPLQASFPPNSNQPPFENNSVSSAKVAISGFSKGYYFYPDPLGGLIAKEIGTMTRKFIGSIIDTILLGFIVFVMVLLSAATIGTFNKSNGGRLDQGQTILLTYVLPIGLSLVYNIFFVWLGGQTLGHRICGLKVIKRAGRRVGLISALVRATWGLIYSFVTGFMLGLILVIFVWPRGYQTKDDYISLWSRPYNSLAFIVTVGIPVIAMLVVAAVMLSNPGRRGMHDYLAGTYVIRNSSQNYILEVFPDYK